MVILAWIHIIRIVSVMSGKLKPIFHVPHASSKLSRGAWMKVMIRSDERGETVVKLNQAVGLCLTDYGSQLVGLSHLSCSINCALLPFANSSLLGKKFHTDFRGLYHSNKRFLF